MTFFWLSTLFPCTVFSIYVCKHHPFRLRKIILEANCCAPYQLYAPSPFVDMEIWLNMMTSSNGNISRVTGPLCGDFTGPGEFPTQRPVTLSFDVFSDLRLNKRFSKQPWGWWFETVSCPLWRHCNAWRTTCDPPHNRADLNKTKQHRSLYKDKTIVLSVFNDRIHRATLEMLYLAIYYSTGVQIVSCTLSDDSVLSESTGLFNPVLCVSQWNLFWQKNQQMRLCLSYQSWPGREWFPSPLGDFNSLFEGPIGELSQIWHWNMFYFFKWHQSGP